MAERSFTREVEDLKLGAGELFRTAVIGFLQRRREARRIAFAWSP